MDSSAYRGCLHRSLRSHLAMVPWLCCRKPCNRRLCPDVHVHVSPCSVRFKAARRWCHGYAAGSGSEGGGSQSEASEGGGSQPEASEDSRQDAEDVHQSEAPEDGQQAAGDGHRAEAAAAVSDWKAADDNQLQTQLRLAVEGEDYSRAGALRNELDSRRVAGKLSTVPFLIKCTHGLKHTFQSRYP